MNIPSNVLFSIQDWLVVEFPEYRDTKIWIAHHCDIKNLPKPVAFPDYPWVHTMGNKSVECYRCYKQIPDTIKTIYLLIANA